jgi:adenosylmethionine-8-amino-7-oxononanoate aminotransferase
MECVLADGLNTLADHPLVDHVRASTGFLGALALDPERLAEEPGLPVTLMKAVRAQGVIVRPLPDAIASSPPLTATEEHIEILVEAVREGLYTLGRSVA